MNNKERYIEEITKKAQLISQMLEKEVESYQKGQVPIHWKEAFARNKWFTFENICYSFKHWIHLFSSVEKIKNWLSHYDIPIIRPRRILLILPGNIPLVGLHDVICTLLTGHQAYVKLSSDDEVLMKHMLDIFQEVGLARDGQIIYKEKIGRDFDGVIASGSNLSANTFRFYFRDMCTIIRGHRNSVAVLSGEETTEEMEALVEDVFVYFGLGCRNVSFFFVPENYDWKLWTEAAKKFEYLLDHTPYSNNYLYYRGYFGMMLEKNVSDKGFYLLRPHEQIHSPIAVIHYKTYRNLEEVYQFLKEKENLIQCVVSKKNVISSALPFGMTQKPSWNDYADNIDTMKFLVKIQ
ncbi:MAG: hypothetical protein N2Z72_06880 [Bacteroidales bacterium]|nr:hypothetical protein [Bacteroidales bacterium]